MKCFKSLPTSRCSFQKIILQKRVVYAEILPKDILQDNTTYNEHLWTQLDFLRVCNLMKIKILEMGFFLFLGNVQYEKYEKSHRHNDPKNILKHEDQNQQNLK